jgi:hypothetical protein
MVQTVRLATVDFTCFKAGTSNLLFNFYFKRSRSICWFVPLPVGKVNYFSPHFKNIVMDPNQVCGLMYILQLWNNVHYVCRREKEYS